MDTVLTVYEAKTHLSKLIKLAAAGKTIYIGSYGNAEAVIAPVPAHKQLNIGVWEHKKKIDYDELEKSDKEIASWLEANL